MYPKYAETKTSVLERIQMMFGRAITQELIENFNFNGNVDIRFARDMNVITNTIAMHIRLELLGEHLERKTVTYPRDWKENCKQALYNWLHGSEFIGHWPWFGAYCRKRWPIMYTVVDIDVRALYPTMAIPEKGELHITRLERMETF